MMRFLIVVLLAMVAAVAMAADQKLTSGPIEVHIMETGGMMKLTATGNAEEDADAGEDDDDVTTPEPAAVTTPAAAAATTTTTTAAPGRKRRETEAMTNMVEIHLNSLKEVDADGKEVGSTKAAPTSNQAVSSFDEVEFTFGTANEDALMMFSTKDDNEKIKAKELSYMKNVGDAVDGVFGMVKITAYIAKEAGNITLNVAEVTEVTEVQEGQVEFTVEISDWQWCADGGNNCMMGEVPDQVQEVGAFLELSITVKGMGEAEMKDTADGMASTYDIGAENMMFVSKLVQIKETEDAVGTFQAMPEGFPRASPNANGMTEMVMRFPMFGKSVWYDPSVRLVVPGGGGVSGAPAVMAASVGSVLVLSLLAALM